MRLTLNGEIAELPQSCTVLEALKLWGYDGAFVAVAINMECVSKRDYERVYIKAEDAVDVVAPQAGG